MSSQASTHASSLLADLLDFQPPERARWLATLQPADLAVVFAAAKRELGSPYGLWQDDPVGFCTTVLGDSLWSKQARILERLAGDYKQPVGVLHSATFTGADDDGLAETFEGNALRLAVPATASPGKTFLGGRAVAWWCSVWPAGTALAVTTAPRMRQVKFLMWPQIRAAHRRGDLAGRVDQAQWVDPQLKDPIAYGFSADEADETAVQGIHAPHLLLVVDEAGGIGHVLGKAFESIMSQHHARLLAIGNPPTDDEGSWFEERCASELWQVERIAASDTPAFTGEVTPRCTSCPPGVPPHRVAMHLTTPEWVDEVAAEFGPESAYVTARVFALFPRGGARKTIPIDWLEQATEPDHQPDASTWVRLGVDVAADGGDEFAIARTVGWEARIVHRSSGAANARPLDVAGDVLAQIHEANSVRDQLGEKRKVRVKIDSIGVGWGVAGILEGWGEDGKHDAEIVRVNVSESANEADRFVNRRAELWWTGRKLLTPRADGSGPRAKIAGDLARKVVAQLHAPAYKTNSSGQVVIQAKAELKRAGLSSPDQAEAVLLAWYEPDVVAPAEQVSAAGRRLPRPPNRQGTMTRLRPRR